MATRVSRTSATPARQPVTFSRQPQELPLSQQAFTALETLKRYDASSQNSTLQQTLEKAAKLLTETVVEINDRLIEEKDRRQAYLQNCRKHKEKEGEGKLEEYEAYCRKVDSLTRTMDENIRKIVDDQQFHKNSPGWIQHVLDKSKEINQQNQRQNEDDEGNEDDPNHNQMVRPDSSENGTALLQTAQMIAETEWLSQSLTRRYANNNTYADFYKLVWDSKNPGEHPPPLPDPSMWFAAQEGRSQARSTQRATQRSTTGNSDVSDEELIDTQEDNDDTEIQMTSDVRSVKCPLTMRYFEEPMTSTLCPHSFEKSAIFTFLRESDKRLPLTAEQERDIDVRFPRGSKGRDVATIQARNRNPKCVQCPVPGCKVMTLTEKDLRPDNVLLRMTRRAQEAERREQEDDGDGPEELNDSSSDDDDEDGDLPRASQRRKKKKRKVYALGSSPVRERRRTQVKPERDVSVIPNSQSQMPL